VLGKDGVLARLLHAAQGRLVHAGVRWALGNFHVVMVAEREMGGISALPALQETVWRHMVCCGSMAQ
jgi:hypothetical protein